MKILVYLHSLQSGGAERVASNLANNWAVRGWHIAVLTNTLPHTDFYSLDPRILRACLNLNSKSNGPVSAIVSNIRRIVAVRNEVLRFKPNMVLAFMASANVIVALACLGLNCRVVGSERIHPPQMPLGRFWEWARRWTYRWVDAVAALTQESANWIRCNTRAKYVPVISNMVVWPIPMQTSRIPPSVVCHEGRRIMLSVGRLDVQKGFDLLLEAFSSISQDHPGWDLVIVGEGVERQKLEAQRTKLHLDDRVFIVGRVGNISDWYDRADLYITSSRYEGFPNTLCEAMASGLASISFNCDTGPRDIIRNHVDGLLVSVGDVGLLASAMTRLMTDDALRARYAGQAKAVRERFSEAHIISKWDELFLAINSERIVSIKGLD
jgi:glycosyltransferase involved in cell wall biosynthesis